MNLYVKTLRFLGVVLFLQSQSVGALQIIEEENLRYVSGQSGVDLDLNFKGTIGRTFFETDGNSLNIRNFSVDTDGSRGDSMNLDADRPIKMTLDLVTRGRKSGLGVVITEINDLDLKFDQFNVNGDVTAGAGVIGQAHSFGGLALTNIYDNGGTTHFNAFARGASGKEGLQVELFLPETLTFNLAYTDYGSNNASSGDDFSFGGDVTLNNFTVANSIDLTSGLNSEGEEVGGLHIGVITQTGDITLSNIRAGTQRGTMGRLVVNGYTMTPESYLTVQGK